MSLLLPYGIVRIEPLEDDSIIPDLQGKFKKIAKVVAVPSTQSGYTPFPNVGDIVFFDEYSYRDFEYDGEKYQFLDTKNNGLWGVLRERETVAPRIHRYYDDAA